MEVLNRNSQEGSRAMLSDHEMSKNRIFLMDF